MNDAAGTVSFTISIANVVAICALIFKAGGLINSLRSLSIDVEDLSTQFKGLNSKVHDIELKVVKVELIAGKRSIPRLHE